MGHQWRRFDSKFESFFEQCESFILNNHVQFHSRSGDWDSVDLTESVNGIPPGGGRVDDVKNVLEGPHPQEAYSSRLSLSKVVALFELCCKIEEKESDPLKIYTHRHTHTHTYMYVCMSVCIESYSQNRIEHMLLSSYHLPGTVCPWV